ncbi:MAG: DUF6503 family protein [Flavobacteriaceae bacterium]
MKACFLFLFLALLSCGGEATKSLNAQQIIDKAIEASGGSLYASSDFSFDFRNKTYTLSKEGNRKVLQRIERSDSTTVVDIRKIDGFQRLVNDSVVTVVDSMARKYSNSINSVHYFAYLPYGLNDRAVNKKLLGETLIKDQEYYKIQVTFDQENGGEDFEDVYVYWFNKKTFKPDYLAYEFHVDGGGMRFREAYNERFVNGVRFVDYKNFKPKDAVSILEIERSYENDQLELLSKIELTNIEVTPGSYN